MNQHSGIFRRLLASFALFALGIAVTMGVAGYFAASGISLQMLEDRSKALLQTMIEAERHSLTGSEEKIDPADLLESLNVKFLAGKQIGTREAALPDGFYVTNDGKDYAYIKNVDGIPFALCGSLVTQSEALGHIWIIFILCGLVSLGIAVVLALILARKLARPVQALVRILGDSSSETTIPMPFSLTSRKDEIGLLARTIQRYQLNAIEQIEREKSFASAASHELRTPLTIISQGLELIESDEEKNERIARTAARLLRTARNMTDTISSLLSLARGEIRPTSKINLNEIMDETICTLFPGAQARHACDKGICRIPMVEDYAIQISGDVIETSGNRYLAMTVFRNLLENALRHHNEGDVTIRFAEKIIEIQNMSEFNSDNPANSGLGLMIAQRACDRMKWKLEQIDSQKITIFRINILT